MLSSLLLALTLSAWPLPRDAGAAEYADSANWPQEPQWSEAWPLYSFTPSGWALNAVEQDAGVGMRVDRAWSLTRGQPEIVLGIVAGAHDLSDPVLASAWRLSAGELPDAGDTNGNGRLDVGDFVGVPDVNANGAIDLEDLIAARSDGIDQDGNGRVDDLCGWDLDRDAPLQSTRDAGFEGFRQLVAPVNDGLPGIGVCPGCTVVPLIASEKSLTLAIRLAADAGVRALLLPSSEGDLSAELEGAITDSNVLLVTEGSGTLASFPLAIHPSVISPRTLTAPTARTTAIERSGCGGSAVAGTISVSTAGCQREAALSLVGIAGLIFSVAPSLSAAQVVGLLGGERVDAERAVRLAETTLPSPITPATKLKPVAIAPPTDAGVPRAEFVRSLDANPAAAFVRFVEQQGPYEWSTALPSPHPDLLRGLLGAHELGAGSGPPRFVDIDGLGSESILALSPRGLVGFTDRVEVLEPPISSSRFAPAFGDFDGDRVLDVISASEDGLLQAGSFTGSVLAGFPKQLSGPLAGAPSLTPTFEGTALVTLEKSGRLIHRLPSVEWTFELNAAQVSAPASGFIDGDGYADFAIANGQELRVLLTDARGPTTTSWSAPSRATQALLANLIGDAELEIVVDRVFNSRTESILELENWSPSVVPPALARVDDTSLRALLQLERRSDGLFELTRYDVQRALQQSDSLAPRRVLATIAHTPARGGFAVADVTSDGKPDVLLPTEDGLLFIIDGEGQSPLESPLPTLGSVISAPAVGVARDQLEFSVRTTRGDLVRWLGRGLPNDITWESSGHDRMNSWNAQTPLPTRRLSGLGVTMPPILSPGCSCSTLEGTAALALVFLFRRRRRSC